MCPKEHEQKAATQPARKEKRKRKRKRALVTQSLGVSVQNHASAGGKKVDRDVYVQVVGPQKPSAAKRDQYGIACLDGPSEIRAGSLGT
jgi:hypothetical protein